MQKHVIVKPGDYRQLVLQEHPDLTPGPGEILIEVQAAGINYADCITRMGLYASAKQLKGYPMTPGFEVAGTVAACGEGVSKPAIGDRVMALTLFDGYASQVVVPATQAFPIPAGISVAEAAGFPTVFLTAWYALFTLAAARPEHAVLVHSAAGCRVCGVVGGAHKVDYAKSLGADVVIDKSSQDLWQCAQQFAANGFDVVLDANGVSTLRQSYRHLAAEGRLVVYGFASMMPKKGGKPNWLKLGWDYLRTPRFDPLDMTVNNKSVLAFNLSFLQARMDALTESMDQLCLWLNDDKIRPGKVTTYPFADAARAQQDLESGTTTGKLVLMVDLSA
ncbi:MAG: zinc-binding dehydrogenase [Gammaproteobacteria bacterium]|nr:zinc-binding dehydrogenase [Gammaproteobacteria bacterium]